MLAALEGGAKGLVLEERPVLDRLRDPREVLVEPPAGADRQVPHLGVPHLPLRQPGGLTRGDEGRVRVCRPEPVEHGRRRQLDRIPRAWRRAPPAVEDDERYEAAASQIPRERLDLERCAAHQRAVDIRLREQLRGVLGLHRAAVEHGHVEQRLHERVRLLGHLGRRRLARADRPHGLVREERGSRAARARTPAGAAHPPSPPARARPRARRRRR